MIAVAGIAAAAPMAQSQGYNPFQIGASGGIAFPTGDLGNTTNTGYNIALVFFGVACLLLGILIYRSTFMPRLVGILAAIAGIGYLINSFVHLLAPSFGAYGFKYILVPCGMGELVLILWLAVMGVNSQRWKERAGAAIDARL